MRWRSSRRSTNVENVGGLGGGMRGGGFRVGLPGGVGRRRTGIGGIGLIIVVGVLLVMGVDPMEILQGTRGPTSSVTTGGGEAASPEMQDFVAAVLGETEDTWHEQFAKMGGTYEEPSLVLFAGAVESACGFAESAMGPFYCPNDRRIYLDTSFFEELEGRFGAPGDFAEAYVIAHEVGHHVQNLLGVLGDAHARMAGMNQADANALSVAIELQADCLAGVWAANADRARNILEPGDLEEALGAAAAVGDDRLQRQAQGYVVPESFTHGSSEQRAAWFRKGLDAASIEACDTFSAGQL